MKQNRCPICEVPKNELGKPQPAGGWKYRDPLDYSDDDVHQKSTRRHRKMVGVHSEPNFFIEYPSCNPYSLWRFDWLHVCILGLIKQHLMNWLIYYLDNHHQTTDWETFLLRTPPYPELQVLRKRYTKVQQWQGKDIRNLTKYLLATLTTILKPANQRDYDPNDMKLLLATRKLLEVVFLAQQRYHTDVSLQSLEHTLAEFHQIKDVFLPARTTGDFNFPKIHLLSHISDHVRQHESSDNWTTDVSEALHMNFKDAYRASNRVNYNKQIVQYMDAELGMSRMRATLTYLANQGYYQPESARILDLQPPPIRILNTRQARRKRTNSNRDAPQWIECETIHTPPLI